MNLSFRRRSAAASSFISSGCEEALARTKATSVDLRSLVRNLGFAAALSAWLVSSLPAYLFSLSSLFEQHAFPMLLA